MTCIFSNQFFRVTDNLSTKQGNLDLKSEVYNQERVIMACVQHVFLFWHLTVSKPCRRFINHNCLSIVLQYYFLFFQVSQVWLLYLNISEEIWDLTAVEMKFAKIRRKKWILKQVKFFWPIEYSVHMMWNHFRGQEFKGLGS